MQITSISYSRLVNLGNYENEKIGGTAALDEQEDPVAAMDDLRAWVAGQIHTQSLINRFLDCLSGWLGIRIRFDGDLVTPESPDDPWWY